MENYLKKELYDLIKTDSLIFEFIQDGSLDGIWYWDIENVENEWMSPRFWRLFGYDSSEKKHLSSEWQEMINNDDLQVALENFNKHCADPNHPYDQIVRYTHKNGSTVWVRCRGVAIRDKNGKPIRMLGAHTDITHLKETEMELVKKTKELESTNKELTEALEKIKILKGIIPICSKCKQIRDDKGYWQQIEKFIQENSEAELSHGICPSCAEKLYGNDEWFKKIKS